MCCGAVGASGKVCIKLRLDCDIPSHLEKRVDNLHPGLYLKIGTTTIYSEPNVQKRFLSKEVLDSFLARDFHNDTKELIRSFDAVTRFAEEESFIAPDFSALDDIDSDTLAALQTKTP